MSSSPGSDPCDSTAEKDDDDPLVLQDLRRFLCKSEPSSLFDKTATAVPVAAIKTLLEVVQRSKAETMMGLQDELKQAADIMLAHWHPAGRSHIALQSGCQLFLKYITRTFLELPDFEECRQAVLERGERFQLMSLAARDRIAVHGADFIPSDSTILTHGWSRVVAGILQEAAKTKHFDVIMLEGRPDASGAKAAKFYASELGLNVKVILDAALGYIMESVDLVLTGAEGVVENGGVVNKIGTAALAMAASANGKPFYVAAESYKFARLYPLSQRDLPQYVEAPLDFYDTTRSKDDDDDTKSDPKKIEVDAAEVTVLNPPVDFTPSKYITLLFTDLGVLTPSAVSDELIRLYQ